jgi:imidazolonepropionase-like amidohydrolase
MVRALLVTALLPTALLFAQVPEAVTIRAGRLLDGRGGTLRDVVVTVRDGKIASVGKASGPVTHDLSKYTLLPGFIDTHVHIGWHFGKDGRFDNRGETPEDRLSAGLANARATLEHGFTTVQSVGEAADLELRKQIEAKCPATADCVGFSVPGS